MRARWAGLAAVSAAAVALDYVLQVRVFVCVFACVGRQSCVLDGQALPQCRQQQQALDNVLQVRVFVCVCASVGGLSCVLDGQALPQCRQQQWHWTTCCRCVCLCVYLLV